MNVRRIDKFSIMLSVFVFYSGHCWADSWQQTVSARASTEFDTNPAMSPTDTGGVWRNIFEPGYTLAGRLGENELKTGVALQVERSSNTTLSPYRESPSAFLDWLRQSDAGELGISSSYAETATRNNITDANALIPVTSTRASRAISGRWRRAMSERSTFSANISYEGVSYTETSSSYIDYSTRSTSMMFSYVWSEYSTPFFQLLHTDYASAGGISPSSFTNTAVAGLNWKASDALEGSLQAGRSSINNAEMSTQGGMTVQYTEQRSVLSLNLNRQVLPSGLGGFVTADQANGSWTYDLSDVSRTGITLDWRRNHFDIEVINRTAGAWIQHELSPFWLLRTYYRHNMLNSDGIHDASSNILGITLLYTHTDF